MRHLFAAMLMIAPFPALAETWWWIGGNEGAQLYIDQGGVTRSGNLAEATVWMITAKPNGDAWSVRIHYRYDCAAKWYSSIDYSVYGQSGNVIRKEQSKTSDVKRQPGENGLDTRALRFACSGPQQGDKQVIDPLADSEDQFAAF